MYQSKSMILDVSILGVIEGIELTLGRPDGANDCEGAGDIVGLEVDV